MKLMDIIEKIKEKDSEKASLVIKEMSKQDISEYTDIVDYDEDLNLYTSDGEKIDVEDTTACDIADVLDEEEGLKWK